MVAHSALARHELMCELLSGMDNEVLLMPAGAAAKPDHLEELGVYTPWQNAMNVSRLSSNSLFSSSGNNHVLGVYWLKIFFFFKAGKADTQLCWTLSHLRVKSCPAFNNKSKVPVYPTSRNLLCSHKNIFREHIRGLCWQGTQRTNIFVLHDYMYSISSLFWIYQNWHLKYIRAARIWKLSTSTELSKNCHWKFVSTGQDKSGSIKCKLTSWWRFG